MAPPGRLYKRFLDTQDTRGESLTQHFWNTQEWNYRSGSEINAKMELNITGLTGAFIPFHVLIKCKIAALRMGSATFEFFLLCVPNDFNEARVLGYLTSLVQFVHNTRLLMPSHNSLWTCLVQLSMLYGPVAHTATQGLCESAEM